MLAVADMLSIDMSAAVGVKSFDSRVQSPALPSRVAHYGVISALRQLESCFNESNWTFLPGYT